VDYKSGELFVSNEKEHVVMERGAKRSEKLSVDGVHMHLENKKINSEQIPDRIDQCNFLRHVCTASNLERCVFCQV